MSAGRIAAQIDGLRRLAGEPAGQAAFALRLVETERNAEVALAALAILTEAPDPTWRPTLLRAYAYYDANPARRDGGGPVRAAILKALGPIALPEDAALLERAAATYEFMFGEVAGDLRAAALLALARVDGVLAGYHAVRLLADPHTSIMSGEPAVTAVRLLAAQGQTLPLYAYVAQAQEPIGDVAAECLRSLTALPASLLPALIDHYRESTDEIVLLGLFDLLLAHETRADHHAFILDFLRDTALYTLYRSLVATLVASRDEALIGALAAMAESERNPRKLELLREALALAAAPESGAGRRRRRERR
jgi:hypothetical protein